MLDLDSDEFFPSRPYDLDRPIIYKAFYALSFAALALIANTAYRQGEIDRLRGQLHSIQSSIDTLQKVQDSRSSYFQNDLGSFPPEFQHLVKEADLLRTQIRIQERKRYLFF